MCARARNTPLSFFPLLTDSPVAFMDVTMGGQDGASQSLDLNEPTFLVIKKIDRRERLLTPQPFDGLSTSLKCRTPAMQ